MAKNGGIFSILGNNNRKIPLYLGHFLKKSVNRAYTPESYAQSVYLRREHMYDLSQRAFAVEACFALGTEGDHAVA